MNQASTSTSQQSGIVAGLRFNPTDYELVHHYLPLRISIGNDFHSDFVHEFPAFFEEKPWEIWCMYGGGECLREEDVKALYFFTHRKKLSQNSIRFNRKMGSGSWSGKYPRNIHDYEGVVIGKKGFFRYEDDEDDCHNSAWLMDEYEIVGTDSDVVLCCLRKNKRPPSAAGDHEKTKLEGKKRKTTTVDHHESKAKAKKQKKEQTCGVQEQDDGSSSSSSVEPPMVEQINNFEQDCYCPEVLVDDIPDFSMDPLFVEQINNFEQDCYCPELPVENKADSINELLGQTSPTFCDDNNLNLVSSSHSHDQVAQFEELLDAHSIEGFEADEFCW